MSRDTAGSTGNRPPDVAETGRVNRQDTKNAKEPGGELDTWAHRVIGAAIEVHRHLGPGFLESVYEEALVVELGLRGIPFRRQVPIPVRYKGLSVAEARLDLLVGAQLVVELKGRGGAPADSHGAAPLLSQGGFLPARLADQLQRDDPPARPSSCDPEPSRSWRSWRAWRLIEDLTQSC